MKRADYIRQNTGKSFVKAMTDEELANFMSAFEKQNGDKLTTKEKYYNWLQEEMDC